MEKDYIGFLRFKYNMQIPQNEGVVIKVTCCAKCGKKKEVPFKMKIYGLRKDGEIVQ